MTIVYDLEATKETHVVLASFLSCRYIARSLGTESLNYHY